MNSKLKVLIFLIFIIILIPLGYKQYINKKIINEINSLNQKGFLVTLQKDESGILTTRQTYKAIVSNPQKIYQEFFPKLFGYTNSPIKNKIFSSLNGCELSIKLNLINFPLTHKNALGIYLTSLPAKARNLQKKELLLQEISTFLSNFGFGESIDMNAFGKITRVKFKDIDQQFDARKGTVILNVKDYTTDIKKFDLKKSSYNFTTYNKAFSLSMQSKNSKSFKLSTKNLKCNIDRNDLYNYTMACNLENFDLISKAYGQNSLFINNFSVFTKSESKNNQIDYSFKYKIKNINFKTKSIYKNNILELADFRYGGSLSGIDKKLAERFGQILSKSKNLKRDKEFKDIVLKFINSGFTFDIDKLSVKSIKIKSGNKDIKLGNIDINIKLNMSKNSLSAQNRFKMADLLKYISINSKIVMLKKDFDLLQSFDKRKKLSKLSKLAKYKGDKIIFEITFKNKMLSINHKKIF